MRFKKAIFGAAFAVVLGAVSVVAAAPAHAVGTVNGKCTWYDSFVGTSSATGESQTAGEKRLCGDVRIRVGYNVSGGTALYTPWRQAAGIVKQPPVGYRVFGGEHSVTVMRVLRVLVPLLVIACASGCTDGKGQFNTSASPSIWKKQAAALADDKVTWDEYKEGFDAYRSCLEKAGFTLFQPKRKEYLMDFGVPGAAVDSGDDARCYDYYWAQVDGKWQVAHDDVSYTARWLANCLRSKGITPKEKKADNADLLKANGIELTDCPTLEE